MATAWTQVFLKKRSKGGEFERKMTELETQITDCEREVEDAEQKVAMAEKVFLDKYEKIDEGKRTMQARNIIRLRTTLQLKREQLDTLLEAKQIAEDSKGRERHGRILKSVTSIIDSIPENSGEAEASAALTDRARVEATAHSVSTTARAEIEEARHKPRAEWKSSGVSARDMFDELSCARVLEGAPSTSTPSQQRHISRPGSKKKKQEADAGMLSSFMTTM